MKILVTNDAGQVVPGKLTEVPANLQSLLCPWAKPEYRCFHFGQILIQEFSCRHFRTYFYRFEVLSSADISIFCEKSVTTLQATLKGKIPGTIKGPLEVVLASNTCNIIYLPEGTQHVTFEAETIESLHFEFDDNYIIDLTEEWPRQEELLALINQASQKGFMFQRVPCDHKMLSLINKIRTCKLVGPALILEFKSYIAAWLTLYLDAIQEKDTQKELPYSPHKEALIRIFDTIKTSPNLQLHTLPRFAKEHYLHPKTISRNFKLLFNTSFQNFVREQCMEKAYHLITSTDTRICDIAEETGYSDTVSFIKAFKKKFHVTPQSLRK